MKRRKIESERIKDMVQIILIVCVGILVISFLIISVKSDEEIIITYLSEQGFSVENLDLTKVEGQRNLYKASKEIDIGDGEMVEYWEIKYYYVGAYYRNYSILPYPNGEWPKLVSVKLLFSPKEYEMLEKMADGEEIEKYLKRVLMNIE